MARKIFMAVLVAIFFIGCAPKFSENSPVYYDKKDEKLKLKQDACILRLNTKLDLSKLDEKSKKQYLGRFNLGINFLDFCYKNKVSHIAVYYPIETHYNIYCTCDGQILPK